MNIKCFKNIKFYYLKNKKNLKYIYSLKQNILKFYLKKNKFQKIKIY